MSGASRKRSGLQQEQGLIFGLIGFAVVAVGVFWTIMHLGASMDGRRSPAGNPLALVIELAQGKAQWPKYGFWMLGGFVAVVVLLTVVGFLVAGKMRRRGGRKAARGDQAGRLMGTGRDLEAISRRTMQATAARLGISAEFAIPIAETVAGRQRLYHGPEDVAVDIWGPRQGKTTSRVIPMITSAPGAVFVTSNKRDVVDTTRGLREEVGQVLVFDPQNIVKEDPTWWWNPLTYIRNEIEAGELAAVFFKVSQGADAKTDSYFTPAGMNLLTNYLLAAALDQRPLTDVYVWLTRPTDREPSEILRDHGYRLNAEGVQEIISAPEKQRAGVFGTAKTVVNFMTNREAMRWCTPQPGDDRPGGRTHFNPAEFVKGTDTLYCISKEGKGSASGLVTAMTVAVADAAEKWGEQNKGGRVPVPFTLVLDEAANVCLWAELPNLYSHFGSRGILVSTILQSWSQGVQVWGREGMQKLWGAATIKVVGSGVTQVDFLQDVAALIGDYETPQVSRSNSPRQGTSYSHSMQRERIMDIADLAALPKGRAIVIAAGTRPALCRTLPWMSGPNAERIRASILRYDPTPDATLDDASRTAADLPEHESIIR